MKRFAVSVMFMFACYQLQAQQLFIPSGRITYEKKINLQRSFSDAGISEEATEKLKKYNISTWELTFSPTNAIYKSFKNDTGSDNPLMFSFSGKSGNQLFSDFSKQRRVLRKKIFNEDYILNDTIPVLAWKVMHETRSIAGYECRKAIGIINDSIYVVAFYTDEILLQAGPEGFSGLPGMILGLAIPRYYTTWFATKVNVYRVEAKSILPPKEGKRIDSEKEKNKLVDLLSRFEGQRPLKRADLLKQVYGLVL